MKSLLLFLVVSCFLSSALFGQKILAAKEAEEALRVGDYEGAIAGFGSVLENLQKGLLGLGEDELRWHQARAHHLAGKDGETVVLCDSLLKDFPESKWRQ